MKLERTPQQDPIARAIWWSSALHVGLFVFLVLKENIAPSTPKIVPPTLRVDLVGLPDIVKKDLQLIKPAPPAKEDPKPVAPPPPAPEVADADDMVLKPKEKVKEKPKPTEKVAEKPAEKPKTDSKDRAKKMADTLARMRAIERLKGESDSTEETTVIKGNQISRGSSLSGEAKESLESSYYDQIRSNISANWSIPAWLMRQKYAAQVQITINGEGTITSTRFLKPSGNEQFDAEVRNTLKASQPLPKPPKDIADSVASRGILVGFPL